MVEKPVQTVGRYRRETGMVRESGTYRKAVQTVRGYCRETGIDGKAVWSTYR